MKKLYLIICIVFTLLYSACSSDEPIFESDPPIIPKDKAYYAQFATNWETYGLKGKVKTREVTYIYSSSWDSEEETIVEGNNRDRIVYEFDENGVLIKHTRMFQKYREIDDYYKAYDYTYTYDSIYRTTEEIELGYKYEYEGGNIAYGSSKKIIIYDDINHKAHIYRYIGDTSDGNSLYPISQYTVNTNINGRIIDYYNTDDKTVADQTRMAFGTKETKPTTYNHKYVIKRDSKGNTVETYYMYQNTNNGKTNTFISSHVKYKIDYYDGPATGQITVDDPDMHKQLGYRAISSAEQFPNLKGNVRTITELHYKNNWNEEFIVWDEVTGTFKKIKPSQKYYYEYDKNKVRVKYEEYGLFFDLNWKTDDIKKYSEEIINSYDNKFRILDKVTYNWNYLDAVLRSTTTIKEQISYDDTNKKGIVLSEHLIDYEDRPSSASSEKIIYNLNKDGFVNLLYSEVYSSTTRSSSDIDREFEGKAHYNQEYMEKLDNNGNWIERYILTKGKNDDGEALLWISDYIERIITYY